MTSLQNNDTDSVLEIKLPNLVCTLASIWLLCTTKPVGLDKCHEFLSAFTNMTNIQTWMPAFARLSSSGSLKMETFRECADQLSQNFTNIL